MGGGAEELCQDDRRLDKCVHPGEHHWLRVFHKWFVVSRLFAAAASLMCLFTPSQVQLDGTVRSSGVGVPNWRKLVDDLAPLDSIRTTLTDGIGPSL